jgi:hypothetical protein
MGLIYRGFKFTNICRTAIFKNEVVREEKRTFIDMKSMGIRIPISIFSLFFCLHIIAQSSGEGFYLRPSFGISANQVDGDNFAGYNKAGLMAGTFVGRNFSEKYGISFGMFFLQKGARKNANAKQNDFFTYRFNINYLDIPFQFTAKSKNIDFTFGLTYSQLISYKEDWTLAATNYNNNMHKYDIGWMLGIEKKLNQSLYAGFRFNYSIIPMRDFFTSPAQPQLTYYNIWGTLFNRGFYNNSLMLYLSKELHPGKSSENKK